MAKNIPVVGGLFEILQDNVSFFGDFSDYATTLESVDGTTADGSEADGDKTGNATSENAYIKTADGLTITCSEVYANSQAVYITMRFKSDKPFPETSTRAESGTPVIDLDMTGGVDFDSEVILKALYAVGLKDEKFYGKAKDRKTVDFLAKKKIFFTISLVMIIGGFVCMGVNKGTSGTALNYSPLW